VVGCKPKNNFEKHFFGDRGYVITCLADWFIFPAEYRKLSAGLRPAQCQFWRQNHNRSGGAKNCATVFVVAQKIAQRFFQLRKKLRNDFFSCAKSCAIDS